MLMQDIDSEKAVICKFECQLDEQRKQNYKLNDSNLELLRSTEALEDHMRLMMD
jgi:hypothetical protein